MVSTVSWHAALPSFFAGIRRNIHFYKETLIIRLYFASAQETQTPLTRRFAAYAGNLCIIIVFFAKRRDFYF